MKEFIDNLIERLEKEKIIVLKTYMAFNINTDLDRMFGIEKSIEITNELAEEYKPKTQADKIRSMSDEELADMLHNIGSYVENGEPLIDIYIGEDKSTVDDSFGFILDWLQSEAE